MATLKQSESRRLYSWWWDSHISPKNSKWLQENLTDMDGKVKSMIKLIEEDADSFARRAEMYYKKRPELMKLVEEFYRAYRALAERYNHATGELRQAHQTMAEAFPDQELPSELTQDYSPEMKLPIRAIFQTDGNEKGAKVEQELQELKNAFAALLAEKDGIFSQYQQCLEKLSNIERELENAQKGSTSLEEKAGRAEIEVRTLNEAVMQLEAEKNDFSVKNLVNLEKISNLEGKILLIQEDKEGLERRAMKSESEARTLKDEISRLELENNKDVMRLESEKNDFSVKYLDNLVKMSNLEDKVSRLQEDKEGLEKKAIELESESQALKDEISRLELENKTVLDLYNQCLGKISNLNKIISAMEGEAEGLKRRAEKSENEVSELKKALDEMHDEKEAMDIRYRGCLDTITKLGDKNTLLEISNKSIRVEADDLAKSIAKKDLELSEKHEELEKLRHEISSVKEEKVLLLKKLENTEENLRKKSGSENSTFNGEKAVFIAEKASLQSQLHTVTENMHRLLERNAVLENSLSSAKIELEGLREKSKGLENIVELLKDERSYLLTERGVLVMKLENVEKRFESLEKGFTGFEEESKSKRNQYEEELEKALKSQFEVSILQKFTKDLEEKNHSLITECQKHVEASKMAEKVISELENESLEQQVETEFILDEIERLRSDIYQIFQAVGSGQDHEDSDENEPTFVHRILENIENLKSSVSKYEDEKQLILVENSVLLTLLEQMESKGVKMAENLDLVRNEKEKRMLRLSEDNAIQEKEIETLFMMNKDLESEICMLRDDMEEKVVRERILNSELQEKDSEFEMWEAEASAFYFDLQISSIREVLFENKVQELTGACRILESQSALKTAENEKMKGKISSMEGEMGELKSQLDSYTPIIDSLRDDIAILERNAKIQSKEAEILDASRTSRKLLEDQTRTPVGIHDLQSLQTRVKAVGKLMEETNAKRTNPFIEQEPETSEIELLNSIRLSSIHNNKTQNVRKKVYSNHFNITTPKLQRLKSKRFEVRTKDIPLDRTIGESLRISFKKRDRGCDRKIETPSTDSDVEKELSLLSAREVTDRKIQEKLASNAKKLENLQITIQSLMGKLEAREFTSDLEAVFEQLLEAEEAVVHLTDMNVQLVKHIEDSPSEDGNSTPDVKEDVTDQIRKVSEEAKKGSEKIDKLQLELQKIQYALVKMEGDKKSKSKNKFFKSKTILLRDFIYTGRKKSVKRKKGPFCGCFKPSTSFNKINV